MGSRFRPEPSARARASGLGVLLAAAGLAGGCGGAIAAQGEVLQPAEVPVRTFPRILIVASEDPEDQRVAQQLEAHLEGGPSSVRVVTPSELRALRQQHVVPPGTAALRVVTTLEESSRPTWAQRDVLQCGAFGCFGTRRAYVAEVPVVKARLILSVSDGRTAANLQRVELEESESGHDVLAMRLRVLATLGTRAARLLDQRAERVTVHLLPVEAEEVRLALRDLSRGRWSAGRQRLEAFVGSPSYRALPPPERARVLYDLALARRFDAALPEVVRFQDAAEALHAAMRLSPETPFAEALRDLESHRRSRDLVRAQEAARSHNFALRGDREPSPIPDPPAAYR
ncbi:MAG: hypothetical protein ACFCGT_12880 [Sandaracinaceae bacterium]